MTGSQRERSASTILAHFMLPLSGIRIPLLTPRREVWNSITVLH